MGYHRRKISKGELGKISKVEEEVEEFKDALDQGIVIMQMAELADIYGALEALAYDYDLTMEDLKLMSDRTKEAFEEGRR